MITAQEARRASLINKNQLTYSEISSISNAIGQAIHKGELYVLVPKILPSTAAYFEDYGYTVSFEVDSQSKISWK